ncbi:hypothetical protein PBY51_005644 [Eleginops maclovinus]|uniref:Uncharacterized protein n=1 Tax=Eleginops maclovinus TaxID=56733 RepID=A0AAN8AHM3_ELEMC|nr:hypothetical protein PBY51_005644 [Eleginops maclovinus]
MRRNWNLRSKHPTNEALCSNCSDSSQPLLVIDSFVSPPLQACSPSCEGARCRGGGLFARRNDDDDDDKKKRSGFGAKMMGLVGLGKKSQNTQINPEEEEKKKKVIRLPVQRSVRNRPRSRFQSSLLTRQPSRDPDAEDPKPGA